MWTLVKSAFAAAQKLRKPGRMFLAVAGGLLVAGLLFWLLDKVIIYLVARSYVDELASAFGLNRNLANAIVWMTFAAAVLCFRLIFSFSRTKRLVGALAVLTLLVGHSLALWYATRNAVFNPADGTAVKSYVVTRDAIRYCERPGTDPTTGRQCSAVTPEIAERIEKYNSGVRPSRITGVTPVFFAPTTGNPVVWYSRSPDGEVELFDLMGFNPTTGEELQPINREVAELWKQQAARRAPRRIANPDEHGWFDPLSGKSRIWYFRDDSGFEFYDAPGFHPGTGEQLIVAGKGTVIAWHDYQAEKEKQHKEKQEKEAANQCYIITRDPRRPVIYGNKPGLDPETGRQCRQITPEVLERLREYEKGKLPARVTSANPTFFDLRTGEAILWYSRTNTEIELFDLMGFHPGTGEELLPITKDVAGEWTEKKSAPPIPQRPPNRVELRPDTVFFDPISGAPRLSYWRADRRDYEFFDGPGFHPQNGDALKPFTKELWLKYQAELKEEQDRIEAEQKAQREAEQIKKQRDDAEAKKRADELHKMNEIARKCDQTAANPNDAQRAGEGVPYAALKQLAPEAVAACERAVQQNPTELRFKYQLGRALELLGDGAELKKNRQRALVIHEELTRKNYPAAFDNLGSLYRWDRKDVAQAVQIFRRGVQLNDSDSMLSLADLIERGQFLPERPDETPIQLYRRAADLGNQNGWRAYQEAAAKQAAAQERRLQQIQEQRMMMQLMGTVFQNVLR